MSRLTSAATYLGVLSPAHSLTRRHLLARLALGVGGAAIGKLHAANAPAPATNASAIASAGKAGPVCLADFEPLAKERLSHFAYEYIASGAGDELTVRWNLEAFAKLRLRPRVLVDVERIDTRVTLFGESLPHPIVLAPTALHRLAHPEGEVATARGAGAAGAPFVVSSLSTRRLADIAAAAKAPLWFQLYDLSRERREFVSRIIDEAEQSGCRALVVTVDAPVGGARNRLQRVGFQLPPDFETPYFEPARRTAAGGIPIIGSFTWEAVNWLKARTRLPILLKGILTPEDARLAVRAGVAGIIVSNHGGRCLDTLPAAIDALGPVVDQVAGRIPVLMDGGIRRGTDVLKALALGARAVLIGRPYLYGLAANGPDGVTQVINILRDELQMAMALTGRPSVKAIDRSVLWS